MLELLGECATQAPPDGKNKRDRYRYTRGDLLGELDYVIIESEGSPWYAIYS